MSWYWLCCLCYWTLSLKARIEPRPFWISRTLAQNIFNGWLNKNANEQNGFKPLSCCHSTCMRWDVLGRKYAGSKSTEASMRAGILVFVVVVVVHCFIPRASNNTLHTADLSNYLLYEWMRKWSHLATLCHSFHGESWEYHHWVGFKFVLWRH